MVRSHHSHSKVRRVSIKLSVPQASPECTIECNDVHTNKQMITQQLQAHHTAAKHVEILLDM